MKLIYKLLLGYFLAIAIIGIFSTFILIYTVNKSSTNLSVYREREITSFVQILNAMIIDEENLKNIEFIQDLFESSIDKLPHIQRLTLHTINPKTEKYTHIVSTDRDIIGTPSHTEDIDAILQNKTTVLHETGLDGEHWIDITYPITNKSNKAIAALGAAVSLHESDAVLQKSIKMLNDNAISTVLMGVLLAIGLSLVFIFIIVRKIVTPIEKLTDATNTFAKGKFTHTVDIHTKDEIGHLSTSFNKMANELNILYSSMEEQIQKITKELSKSNMSLKKAKETAEQASRYKSTFLANMSHEIRTPLNAINGFISLLIDDEKDSEKLKYLNIINTASDTLLHTINDILDISRIESGKLNISKVNFLTYKEIMSVVELFQAKAAEKKITLVIDYDSTVPKVLYSDILRIKQVLNNLLSNAVKFTSENGKINLEVKYIKNQLYISVKDNGIGISAHKIKDIFDPFSQADSSIVREHGGSGLGLSISVQLINMLGGKIEVKSIEHEYSKFFFSIPMEEGELEEEKVQINFDKPLRGKVLLVEDIITNQMFIGLILQKNELEYDIANDGIEAVEQFKKKKYDLILMDENMPRLHGIGATEQIRKIEDEQGLEHTPIIAVTANALNGEREKFLDAGMDDYLSKPIEPDSLLMILHKYMNGTVVE